MGEDILIKEEIQHKLETELKRISMIIQEKIKNRIIMNKIGSQERM